MTMDDEKDRHAKLGALLTATDAPARALIFPAARIERARGRRRLARGLSALALVLLAGAALVPPVRAWIVGAARHLLSGTPQGRATESPGRRSGFASPPNGASFAATSDQFVVSVATRQAAGALRFQRSPDASVHAGLTGDPAEAALVVLPAGLRIVNGSRVKQDYVVSLPASVTRVQVRVGDEAPRDVPLDAGGRAMFSLASEATGSARSNQ